MTSPRRLAASPALLALALGAALCPAGGCGDDDGEALEAEVSGAFVVLAPAAREGMVRDFLRTVPIEGATVAGRQNPSRELTHGGGAVRVALVDDARCDGCYRVDGAQGRYTVRGGGALGLQYGLAHLLEEMGVRFFHPWRTYVPAALASPDSSPALGKDHQPEMTVRGLHLHTLHPIEPYFEFWEPGDASLDGARRTIDWLVKNRGNYVQWPALDSVARGDEASEAWRKHTRAIVDFAHDRGVQVGLGIQLFGTSSLQRSLTLLRNTTEDEPRDRMREQYTALLRDLPVDRVSLSFGEFSGSDPDAFVGAVNMARDVLAELAPKVELDATVHVGNYPKLRVTYQGETLLYYFLVKFADPRIIPSIHTVMYYDLFEDAGGAYLHDDFSEHRAFLLDRLKAGQRAIYHPESAYWVAFDNSVPTYLPLYVHSRHVDMAQARQQGAPLREHILFSSGWEWGYWQNDYATLRMNYELPDAPGSLFAQMFAPWGEAGQSLAQAIDDAASAQHDFLIGKRLAPYLAGRDFLIDLGAKGGTIAAPDRPSFEAVAAMSPEQQTTFESSVVAPLGDLASALDAQRQRAASASLPGGGERFQAEVVDGLEVTARRASFIQAAYKAALAHARSQDPAPHLAAMDAAFSAGQAASDRRHADLHSPLGERLFTDGKNETLYGYGYLREARSLCFWRRERVQVQNLLTGASDEPPGCVL